MKKIAPPPPSVASLRRPRDVIVGTVFGVVLSLGFVIGGFVIGRNAALRMYPHLQLLLASCGVLVS